MITKVSVSVIQGIKVPVSVALLTTFFDHVVADHVWVEGTEDLSGGNDVAEGFGHFEPVEAPVPVD
jgi:hypothetical protein